MTAAAIACTCLALAGCGRIGFGFGGDDASPLDATDAPGQPVDACPSQWGPATRLAAPSTSSAEYAPGLSGDGLELYFESNRSGTNDIWVATRNSLGSEFGMATLASVSSANEDVAPFMSADGKTLYFASNRSGADRLYQATRQSPTGPFNTPMIVPGFETTAVRGATISTDGDEILWATGPASGISRSVRLQGAYVFDRALTELGMTARFPSLSADGKTIYFGAMGASSVDLFTATRDANGTFSVPEAVALNDVAWDGDPDVSRDGQTLVFASERAGSEGSGDLWISKLVCD
ncbi:MAG TPA: hypothetical protein VIU61_29385 [Kofleriaceae bacterium]